MACIWCENARKTCRACGRRVCPKHASAANGCCVPCLEAIQEAVREGRCTDQLEEEAIEQLGGPEAAVYGEITPLGFRAMARRLGLSATDAFADLGSGLGRVVLQAVKEFNVRRSCGVEMALSRHLLAEALRDSDSEAAFASRVRFINDDCAADAVWREHLDDTTVVYASNLLFGPELMERLARCLEGCATVRVVASLKPFPSLAGFREELPREMVETSWRAPEEVQQAGAIEQPGSLMYIYRRVAVGIVAASSPSCDAHVTSQAPAAPGAG